METIKITVLDYYNRPGYYPFMPQALFDILETAFLKGKIKIDVDLKSFDKMINDLIISKTKQSWKQKQ